LINYGKFMFIKIKPEHSGGTMIRRAVLFCIAIIAIQLGLASATPSVNASPPKYALVTDGY